MGQRPRDGTLPQGCSEMLPDALCVCSGGGSRALAAWVLCVKQDKPPRWLHGLGRSTWNHGVALWWVGKTAGRVHGLWGEGSEGHLLMQCSRLLITCKRKGQVGPVCRTLTSGGAGLGVGALWSLVHTGGIRSSVHPSTTPGPRGKTRPWFSRS